MVDYVLIVDTGSTDGTQEVIRAFLKENNLPGDVAEEPWKDFAWNRSQATAKLRDIRHIDYGLMLDADEVAVFDRDFDFVRFKRSLSNDYYYIPSLHGAAVNLRPQLFNNQKTFIFKGVLHEYLESPSGASSSTVQGFHTRAISDSARNKNPRKYLDDAKVLEIALKDETDPFLVSRYTFYLAQSYRDGGEPQLALQSYLKRAEQGFWDQEVYISLYSAASLKEELGLPFDEVLGSYLRAYDACPARVEALHGAARFCRLQERFHTGYMLAQQGLTGRPPQNALFVYQWMYDYGVLDEFSICAYWASQYAECVQACRKLLRRHDLPDGYADRIQQNLNSALDRLKQNPSNGSRAR